MYKHFVILVVLVLALSGCSSPNYCFQDMNTAFNVKLYKMVFNSTSEKYEEQAYTTTVTVHGLDNDSMLYNQTSLSSFSLPLKKLDTLSTFLIDQMYVEGVDTSYIQDTLWIRHYNTLEFVSMECGCASIYDVKSVLYSVNGIDSVKVVSTAVDRSKADNLKIYVRK